MSGGLTLQRGFLRRKQNRLCHKTRDTFRFAFGLLAPGERQDREEWPSSLLPAKGERGRRQGQPWDSRGTAGGWNRLLKWCGDAVLQASETIRLANGPWMNGSCETWTPRFGPISI